MKKFLLAAALAGSALVGASPASAAFLLPGTLLPAFLDDYSIIQASAGTLLTSGSASATASSFSGSLTWAVYKNTSNTLDFYYQATSTGAGTESPTHAIDKFTVANFGAYTVDAYVSTAALAGFAAPNNGDVAFGQRSLDAPGVGNVLTVNFLANGLLAGESSNVYVFRTNAETYTAGTFGLLDGVGTGGLTVAPGIPEPSTWAMMLTGFGAVGYSLRRRKSYKLIQAV
jgi:hypothetical protein